ncbi:hypothetical protein HPP92_012907 [Vanilla planifolia]|uniref:Uncharacterized protein n=1 Tax=Vanilla planifolia TaxID=51239 RepID=A0A835UY46_VANPL|nr:hypothetical protein HPP92_012907 [Vanilla planifolia]
MAEDCAGEDETRFTVEVLDRLNAFIYRHFRRQIGMPLPDPTGDRDLQTKFHLPDISPPPPPQRVLSSTGVQVNLAGTRFLVFSLLPLFFYFVSSPVKWEAAAASGEILGSVDGRRREAAGWGNSGPVDRSAKQLNRTRSV